MNDTDDKNRNTFGWDEIEDADSDEEEITYEELDFEEQDIYEKASSRQSFEGKPRVRSREEMERLEEEWEDEWEDEPEPMKPVTMVLAFAVLVILAALICAILWHFTHGSRDKENQTVPSAVEEEMLSEEAASPEPAATPEASALPEVTASPEPAATPEASALPEVTASPEPAATPEASALPEVTASPEPAATPEAAATPEPTAAPEAAAIPDAVQSSASESTTVQEPVSGNETMVFSEVQETVTAKDVINLRSVPSTADAGNIVTQAQNGETLSRTGINNDTGWSRIDYNGQTLYAVSQYLTTDLSYKTPVQTANPNRVSTKDGRVILFTDCDDNISPKEYVNLRLEPSTSEGNSTVHCQLNYGEVAHRTGYSPDSGWSRVEYDGKVLYVVTSMIYVVTE